MEKLYNWMMQQAESKNATKVMLFVSFVESSFFPLPPDPILAMVVAKNRNKALYYAAICAVASILGGFLGYYIGYAFFEILGSKVLSFYGQMNNFENMVQTLNKWAFWIICAKGLTPIPYKIITIACGFAKINLMTFAIASIITRSARFLLLSFIFKRYGQHLLNFMEKHKKATVILVVMGVLIGFALVKVISLFYE